MVWIRTKSSPHWYIFAIRGVVFITWVSERDKGNASVFPEDRAQEWINILEKDIGIDLEYVRPFV